MNVLSLMILPLFYPRYFLIALICAYFRCSLFRMMHVGMYVWCMYVCMYVCMSEPGRSSKLTHYCVEFETCAFETSCHLSSAASTMSSASYFDHISVVWNELTGQLAAGGVALVWKVASSTPTNVYIARARCEAISAVGWMLADRRDGLFARVERCIPQWKTACFPSIQYPFSVANES